MQSVALVFILIFWAMLLVPCIGAGWIGWQLITKLGQHPSKTPSIQMGILLKLIIVEIVSFTLILTFFKALVSE